MVRDDDPTLRAVIAHVTAFVRERGEELGARISAEVVRQFPLFDYRDRGFVSLTDLLDRAAPELSIVGRRGLDYLWSTEADLSTFELDHQLTDEQQESRRLTYFRARRFKSLAQVDVPLRAFNVVVGANGAGKTSILSGMHLLSQLRHKKPAAIFTERRPLAKLTTIRDPGPLTLRFEDDQGSFVEYEGQAFADEPDSHIVRFSRAGEIHQQDHSRGTIQGPLLRQVELLRSHGGTTLLRLDARQLARPWASDDEEPSLRFDGAGLPAVLANLAATDRDRLDRIFEATRAIIPAFEGARMPRQNVLRRYRSEDANEIGNGLELRVHGNWLDARLASEGTLLVLGLMTVVHGVSSTWLLLMDDIERALHPKAQRSLVAQLASLCSSGLQIVCTTHSPYLLDAVDPEDVLVARAALTDGHTRVRRLVEHDDWAKWSRSMTPGVFWSYVGEDWLEAE